MPDYHFISYSTADAADFAVKLTDLLGAGPPVIRVWLDKREERIGDWDEQIRLAIKGCKTLLFVMTRDSVDAQSVCTQEWDRALQYRKPVVPILLHADVETPFRLGRRQYVDFSDDFEAGIARLRQYLMWLDSSEGKLQTLRDQRTDKCRELRRATDRLKIASLERDISAIDESIRTMESGTEPVPAPAPPPPGPGPTPPRPEPRRETPDDGSHDPVTTEAVEAQRDEEHVIAHEDVYAFDTEDPPPDVWYRKLRPVLHQATHYSVPTYFLDENLKVIDWNVAFELIFWDLIGSLRYKHVNWLIVKLDNRDEVFEHARRFTEDVRKGVLPLVDLEPLRYRCKYGRVLFEKVASQLHDATGKLCGWAVALIIREINWVDFLEDLRERLWQDKLWSVYSHSYDAILNTFPPYRDLIKAVTSFAPPRASKLVDLGAGSGNCTAALLQAGHRVTAVEINLGMLERLRNKNFDPAKVTIVKGSVEHLGFLDDESFDGAVMMNVLYAVDDPLTCLQGISRILKPGAVLSYSTTHADVRLQRLLDSIRKSLIDQKKFDQLALHYHNLREANEEIERTIACRFTRDEYLEWTHAAGFELLQPPTETYEGAVMLVHARKR
jgi:ubiquinone/menaquinone biosynthesis C-methylase UbiE